MELFDIFRKKIEEKFGGLKKGDYFCSVLV